MPYVQPTQINPWHHTIPTTFSLLLEILTRDGQVTLRLQDPTNTLFLNPGIIPPAWLVKIIGGTAGISEHCLGDNPNTETD